MKRTLENARSEHADNIQGRILFGEPMSRHTSFRIGGPAEIFVEAAGVDDVVECIRWAKDWGCELRFIGNGTNLLVADSGLPGITVRIGKGMSGMDISDDGMVTVGAGTPNALVARKLRESGFSGYEFAAGIPGTVGGAAIMNAGAYGGQFCDACVSLELLELHSGNIEWHDAGEFPWGYRASGIDDSHHVVLSAKLGLDEDDPANIDARMREFAESRRVSQPHAPSAGSVFKRVDGVAASRLIDEMGLKGLRVGAAEISRVHAGFIVNSGGASADDVRELIEVVSLRVKDRYGVVLQPEVKMLGF